MNTNTPETDAFAQSGKAHYMALDFARKLERERDEARAEIAKFKANNRYQRGYHDGELSKSNELTEMREAIREACDALRQWRSCGSGMSTDFALQSQAFRAGQVALAKLQPLLK
jgi:hypothetical protein